MKILEWQQHVDQWIHQYGVRYFNELTNTALLMEEVGEMARILARIYGEQSFKSPITTEEQHRQLKEEIADVLFVLTCIANQTGVNLEEALNENLQKKTDRDHSRHQTNQKLTNPKF